MLKSQNQSAFKDAGDCLTTAVSPPSTGVEYPCTQVWDGGEWQTYRGISRMMPTAGSILGSRIAVVRFEGQAELWFLYCEDAYRELVRYYADQGWIGATTWLATFDGFWSDPKIGQSLIDPVFE